MLFVMRDMTLTSSLTALYITRHIFEYISWKLIYAHIELGELRILNTTIIFK